MLILIKGVVYLQQRLWLLKWHYIINTNIKKDILILTNSQSVCKRIISNRIERNQNNNIVTIKERIEVYTIIIIKE